MTRKKTAQTPSEGICRLSDVLSTNGESGKETPSDTMVDAGKVSCEIFPKASTALSLCVPLLSLLIFSFCVPLLVLEKNRF